MHTTVQPPQEDPTMSTEDAPGDGASFAAHGQSQSRDEHARQESRRAVDTAVLRMARAAGASVHQRPIFPDSTLTTSDTEPLPGIWFALMLQDAVRHKIHDYIKQGRQDGSSWQQIGKALRLEQVAGERGTGLGEAAFDYAAGADRVQPADRLWFAWTCLACGAQVIDCGPYGHPLDYQTGHADGCKRLAADIAGYQARWAEED
jgi:hypothetical protein